MSLGTAFRAFFGSLFNSEVSERVRAALDDEPSPAKIEATPPAPAPPKPPVRSDAIALLATLQREARLVDLIQEKLDSFSDAQVGAAARSCLQQSAATLDRIVGLKPMVEGSEGQSITVPEDASAAAYQWIGEGSGNQGQLVHHGWHATRLDLPEWTGQDADARVVAPAQVKR
ncbi:DUF2760 domain-containing protein [Roseimaritima ulvae]|uniref:DUF2760 domain-containing protein n=1 Tax=Roseimaritima ulvae TaxID=980254 RepID=A0A5B9QHT3_9BACT|nr:DUF2760 domain-containing protein [Roseimaritima ulvae]QEG38618.1 hypothetical protein UC8_05760 [Roseimaritima ulvae]